jgi:pyrroline-5-carboxylate reductase
VEQPDTTAARAATRLSARIAFVGGGNMARAMIAGLVRHGHAAECISVGEPREAARAALARDYGVRAHADNAGATRDAALIVLAVKPQHAAAALDTLRERHEERSVALLSIAAGLRIADLARLCAPGTTIMRAMPNRPALMAAGVTGLYAPPEADAPARSLAETVAGAIGRAVWLPQETDLDVVTALSGSGPAYFLLLAEQLALAAARCGLSHETALLLATETLYGTGLLAHEHAGDVATALSEERGAVTSAGGTTEAALRVLQAGGFEQLIARAVQAAAARSAELAAGISAALGARG